MSFVVSAPWDPSDGTRTCKSNDAVVKSILYSEETNCVHSYHKHKNFCQNCEFHGRRVRGARMELDRSH